MKDKKDGGGEREMKCPVYNAQQTKGKRLAAGATQALRPFVKRYRKFGQTHNLLLGDI
jgi:hypothetical protein